MPGFTGLIEALQNMLL